MWRKFFKRLALFSLVLCLGTIGWWFRTAGKVDQVTYSRESVESLRLSGYGGKLVLTHALNDPTKPRLGAAQLAWNSSPASMAPVTAASFSYAAQPTSTGGRESILVMPMWLLAGAFAVMPLCWVAPKFKRKKKSEKKQ